MFEALYIYMYIYIYICIYKLSLSMNAYFASYSEHSILAHRKSLDGEKKTSQFEVQMLDKQPSC